MLQCVAVCCSVLQCVAVCCSVLQCVAVCCSEVLPADGGCSGESWLHATSVAGTTTATGAGAVMRWLQLVGSIKV